MTHHTRKRRRIARRKQAQRAKSFADWLTSSEKEAILYPLDSFKIFHRATDNMCILLVNPGLSTQQGFEIEPERAFRLADDLWSNCEAGDIEAAYYGEAEPIPVAATYP
ncbi:hypothetical protein K32_31690 [Kaistia sp. 32K]|uniref:hypothetical protein n=1 Tax=Kaistia sp. 32K TaxID=2795690 RepID=UPI00191609BC|nr:hypothetical protein [Kaistia sp. 32K]BCP54552.1 hypothetical protein K32_31690 [Kaistia sp. 32K]